MRSPKDIGGSLFSEFVLFVEGLRNTQTHLQIILPVKCREDCFMKIDNYYYEDYMENDY